MRVLTEIPGFLKYFRVISPSEIIINKEDIFYRDKYNDIINYIKVMATFSKPNLIENYLSPKGAILINISPGTDIIDFVRLISTNYHLDLIELIEPEIKKTPQKFLSNFIQILETIVENTQKEGDLLSERELINNDLNDNEEKSDKKIMLINQQLSVNSILEERNLLEIYFDTLKDLGFNFLNSNIILIWINYEIQDIVQRSSNVYNSFDLFIRIPLMDKIERETVCRDFLERNPRIVFDINAIVNFTDNWEVRDMRHLFKVGIFKQYLNSELNEKSNEITQILLDLIDSGEFLPSNLPKVIKNQLIEKKSEAESPSVKYSSKLEEWNDENIKNVNDYVNHIQISRVSDFMLGQLYENAAFLNYNELNLIIDKLDKNEVLEENEMKLLAKYPFILNDQPTKAKINLEKAKKRVDSIKQVFGK
ncbi:MAG: hypothetical protein ACFFE4_21770 [Candidatus Thorarchaeota archaeon]